jgi:hypothetical protein
MNNSQPLHTIFVVLAFCSLSLNSLIASDSPLPGHVEGWGDNFFGQASPPPGLDGVIAIAAGNSHSLALLTNGTVVAWGSNFTGETHVPAGLSNVVAISARAHSVALKKDGTVVVWGSNFPEVTNPPPSVSGVKAISAGSGGNGNMFTLALLTNGTVVAWGDPSNGEASVPAGLTGVVDISAGSYHALALKSDGSVVGWGLNDQGQATPPPGLTGVIAVRAGQFTSFALKSDGSVFKWGGNDANDPPFGVSGLVDLRTGNQHVIGLRSDGTLIAWGYNASGQGSVPPGLNGVTAISAGGNFNLVLTPRPLVSGITPPVVVNVGASVRFTVTATGNQLSYQWQHKGTNLPARTSSSIILNNVQLADAGTYTVMVSNPYGSVFSPATSLSFLPPQITTQPKNLTLYRGEKAAFNVVADGFQPLSYQWKKADLPLSDATSSDLNFITTGAADSGNYTVVVTDAAGGSVTSSPASLQVIDPRLGTLTVTPSMDTSFFSSGINPRGTTILVGTRNNGIVDRGLLRFDLSSLTSGALIQSARLRINVVKTPLSPANSNFSLYRMLTPWDANASWANATAMTTWSGLGTLAGVDYSASASATQFVSGVGSYEFASTSELLTDLQAWITNPLSNNGWLLKCESESVGRSARHFGSSESTTPPQLIIDYSLPAPSPTLTALQLQSTNLTFQISGAPGWIYSVERRDQVDHGPWIEITNAPSGAATNPIPFSLPLTPPQGFYRITVR